MDEYRTEGHYCHRRNHWLKYFGCMLATLVGAFLAFYFLASCTFNHFINHAYMMKQIHKMNRIAEKDMAQFQKDEKFLQNSAIVLPHKNAVEFIKTPDSYKFIVDLMPFQGNKDAVNVEVKNNKISISGESEYSKNNTDTYTSMSQTYSLGKDANVEKLSKKKVGNKYIITIPIED